MADSGLMARVALAAETLKRNGVTQRDVAEMLGASQPQISRILSGNVRRPSRLLEEVCCYAERLEQGVTPELVKRNEELLGAVAEVWDGTTRHAKALAIVIRSLAVLRLDRTRLS